LGGILEVQREIRTRETINGEEGAVKKQNWVLLTPTQYKKAISQKQ